MKYDQFACLKYLVEQGVPWDIFADYIASYGNIRMLKFAAEKGCPFTSNATYYAARGGHAECLRYLLYTIECELYIGAVAVACRGNHLECVQILHEHGAELGTEACAAAAENGHFVCLKFLYENGCPWNDQTSLGAARRGDIEMLHYVLSRGCPYCSLILETAAACVSEEGFKCFKYFVEDVKVPTTNFSAMLNHSFTQGNYFIFQYVFELEPTCQSQKITWPFELRWILHSMRGMASDNTVSQLDANILRCIQCLLQHNWNIDKYGHDMVQFLADQQMFFPLSFARLQPWYDQGLGSKKRKKVVS